MSIITHNLGFPRIGAQRELKRALESFWAGKSSENELKATGQEIRRENWRFQKEAGLELIPSNDFSFYDHVLDTAVMVGAIPERFHWSGNSVDLSTYFAMARGLTGEEEEACPGCEQIHDAKALEMTKWFDTNYHYLVPELTPGQEFKLTSTKAIEEFNEAKELGIETKPVLLGPVSFLLLGKLTRDEDRSEERLKLLPGLLPVYVEVLKRLAGAGATWVQLDEPFLALDLTEDQAEAIRRAYLQIRQEVPSSLRLLLATYFEDVTPNQGTVSDLPVDALHIDLSCAADRPEAVMEALPEVTMLSLGIVNGRNIWRTEPTGVLETVRRCGDKLGWHRLMLAPSCSLLHVPVSLRYETKLDEELKNRLSFAEEKVAEVAALARLMEDLSHDPSTGEGMGEPSRRFGERVHRSWVKERCAALTEADFQRTANFSERRPIQHDKLGLPAFPTTTIGSFPQTKEVRRARARWKRGELATSEYKAFLEGEIRNVVETQERVGLDVLVHGEFERNDMVEYFSEQLSGFAFTENGWVQSYGSRCVKPPVIFGDVERPKPMTVDWSKFAQSLTSKPMKGMLTGPVTLLKWSFVRDDQALSETAKQLALAIRDETRDLEAAGIKVIQIDEPALREGLPLRGTKWSDYLKWAVEAFRLATSGVQNETQIHTHMCYCEFNDIIDSIAALDADVISIETSRSNMELLEAFVRFRYPHKIGPGVWDIHSPRVPSVEEMVDLIHRAARVIPPENLWVNPDCGLKTRSWKEVTPALERLVQAAVQARTGRLQEKAIS